MCLSILTITLFLGISTTLYAAPYIGQQTFTYHQPDGSKLSVKLYGDEFFVYQRTLDGREIVKDPKTGFFCYARLSADGKLFVSTGIPVITKAKESAKK